MSGNAESNIQTLFKRVNKLDADFKFCLLLIDKINENITKILDITQTQQRVLDELKAQGEDHKRRLGWLEQRADRCEGCGKQSKYCSCISD